MPICPAGAAPPRPYEYIKTAVRDLRVGTGLGAPVNLLLSSGWPLATGAFIVGLRLHVQGS